ncbi:TPA: ORF6N domain-containing protein [Salmonella enterica]|nr:ORF6N domain-containing protein [Salmonella enterica subsp. enterica serovar Muenster]EDY8528743.1 ORF6N domain-containing protein [Salmonella enterica]EEO8835491.1 ORF6N domain-containing protein [Salmonella enterica]EHN6387305.1 ORF6N domain-containing protein [Salmonella enterica]EHO6563640.1 ORF6N domain-containing protein [Salmonella enterica]
MTTQISVETLSPITHNQIPVITTELLAHLYGTKIKNISDNFLNNTTRFVVGKHFFKIEKNELREFKNRPETIGLVGKNARSLILWTERGAARHAKMLETDQAWEVFEKLEDCYFSQTLPSPTRQVQPAVDMLNIDLLIKIRDGNVKDIRQVGAGMFVGKVEQILSGLRDSGWIVIKRDLLAEKLATW